MLHQAHSLVSCEFYRVDRTLMLIPYHYHHLILTWLRSFFARFAFSFHRRNRSCCQVSQSRKLHREYAVYRARECPDIESSVTRNDVYLAKIPAHVGENMAVYFSTDFPFKETLLRNILQVLRLVMQHSAYFRSHQFVLSPFHSHCLYIFTVNIFSIFVARNFHIDCKDFFWFSRYIKNNICAFICDYIR